MSIESDSKSLEEPKDPETDKTFTIYALIATPEQTEALREKYLAGNFGYGHAKTELLNLILERFAKERELLVTTCPILMSWKKSCNKVLQKQELLPEQH